MKLKGYYLKNLAWTGFPEKDSIQRQMVVAVVVVQMEAVVGNEFVWGDSVVPAVEPVLAVGVESDPRLGQVEVVVLLQVVVAPACRKAHFVGI